MIERVQRLADRITPEIRLPHFGWLEWTILAIAIVAAGMRLWELDGRTMHYDEAIHLHFAWKLAQGVEFIHSPWMHGPLQIELVAIVLNFVGDTEFIARLPYALFGVALVVLPYFLRYQIGHMGAVCAAVILALSPTLLYFSRFGRNDILMVVWALLLFILMWRYTTTSRRRYLYWSALVVALMLATKETAFFIILFFGVAALALGIRQLREFGAGQRRFASLGGAAGFFVFLAALTLPQAAAMVSVIQEPLGLVLVAPDMGSTGETGAPVWGEPFVTVPFLAAPVWWGVLAAMALTVATVAASWISRRPPTGARTWRRVAATMVAVVSAIAAVALITLHPLAGLENLGLAAGLALVAGVVLRLDGWSVRRMVFTLGPSMLLTWLGLSAFSPDVAFTGAALPEGVGAAADLEAGRVAVNYLVPMLVLVGLLAVSVAVGVAWGGGVWLAAAAIFYAAWTTLYTTMFTNAAGIFTGSWQSLGYWLAQQEEARGNQPWYYYAVGLTVYEQLALVFGIVAVVWLIRRRERFGLVLAGWVIATLTIYTIAGEKMPWLLVNMTVPLALAAGMFLGHLADTVPWGRLGRRNAWLLILAPSWVVAAVWIAWLGSGDVGTNIAAWLAGLILLPGAALIAWLMRGQPRSGRAVALGVAALLLAFGTLAAVRAAYTYDDSRVEILVYAQGSADLAETYGELRQSALENPATPATVKVDYDMWYPFQWYVRSETEAGVLQFDRFCRNDADEDSETCRKVGADAGPLVYLAESGHAVGEEVEQTYAESGPMRNLLWYPETYRRPGEIREETSFWQQLRADVDFFSAAAGNPNKWREALGYIVGRHQESDWYKAEYYQYDRK